MVGKRVLIVEDEIEFAEMVKLRLELEGFDVTIAEDAYQGNKEILNNQFDLIVMDLLMPVGSGFDLIKKIRELPDKGDIPIIVMTGKTVDEDVITKANKYNVSAIFTKPYDGTKFVNTVKSILEKQIKL